MQYMSILYFLFLFIPTVFRRSWHYCAINPLKYNSSKWYYYHYYYYLYYYYYHYYYNLIYIYIYIQTILSHIYTDIYYILIYYYYIYINNIISTEHFMYLKYSSQILRKRLKSSPFFAKTGWS